MPVGSQDPRAPQPGRRRSSRTGAPGRHRRRPGLGQVLRRATAVAVCGSAGLALGFGIVPAMDVGSAFFSGGSGGVRSIIGSGGTSVASPPPTRVERLVAEHDCWTDSPPEATLPRLAVVTLPGKAAEVTTSDVGFELWLGPDGEPETGDERAGRLHAFCP